jgi:DNA-binding transcriptional MerR regulator
VRRPCYFPPEDEASSLPADVPFVKTTVYQAGRSEVQKKSAHGFLTQAGVRTYDVRAGIERILELYPPAKPLPLRTHISHIRQFVRYWRQSPTDIALFDRKSFLVNSLSDGKIIETCFARAVCLDAPFDQTGLAGLFGIHKKIALWDGYQNELGRNELQHFISFLKAVGVMFQIKVERASVFKNPHWNSRELAKDYHYGVATKMTSSAISTDYTIPHCVGYLKSRTFSASRLVWDALVKADDESSKALFRPNQKHPIREAPSQLVCHLRDHAWIPDKSGEFRSPAYITREDLRSDFPYDDRNGLLTAIGFGEHSKKRSEEYQIRNREARKWGFASAEEAAEYATLRNEGITLADIRSLLAQRANTEQPKQSVPDPERRRKNVLANTEDAPDKESIRRERTIQKGISEVAAQARAYLRAKYKNEADQLVCQCCHLEMPFRLGSGEHYFEAVQCINDKETRHYQNRLALCPTCAAMYQYARETDDAETRRRIVAHGADDKAPSVDLPVRLAGQERAIRFVGTHWFDLKTILSVREP